MQNLFELQSEVSSLSPLKAAWVWAQVKVLRQAVVAIHNREPEEAYGMHPSWNETFYDQFNGSVEIWEHVLVMNLENCINTV